LRRGTWDRCGGGKVSALAAETAKAVKSVHDVGGRKLVVTKVTTGEYDDGKLDNIKKMVLEKAKKAEKKKVRGCSHEIEKKNAKFCSICGAETWIEYEVDDHEVDIMVDEAFCEFVNQLESMPGVHVEQEAH